ncbi:MAG: DinB family protein [Bacteroidia bacterium]|nr:DinB family protein [Bacteroidia bacterium]
MKSGALSKSSIADQLNVAFEELIDYCESQDDQIFEIPLSEGKWSTAQNLDHLCSSTFPLIRAMKMPKFTLRMSFGRMNRNEKTFDQLLAKYKKVLQGGVVAPTRFSPNSISNDEKKVLLSKFNQAKTQLLNVLNKWEEGALSKYIIPHPALGKLTMREMLYFTIFHTRHHLNIIQKINS